MYSHGSFNRVYRLVWSALHQTWVVASELAGGRSKSSSTPLLSAALLASLTSLSGGLWAAPQGGQVVGGSGSISASGSTTTINQASDKLSINWQSFNVAKTETVNFVQPSASALAVNRIFDTQGSQILGRINANGQVWLINPNGVLFGKDAQINVGGLVASTLNPDDASIGSARSNFSGTSTAGVVNLGTINAAQGGYVALLGHSVSNQGSISAPGGTVALGAGSAVSLNFAGSKLLGLEVTSNQVNALTENGGLIQADGGQVLLSAGARESLLASVVNNTGIIQAHTVQEQDGKIVLLGGMAAGTANVKGTLDASAPNGGNGGFIDTSAYTVQVDDSAKITTASAQGTQGQWLIDPFDFYVKSSGGNITGAALSTALGNNNVTIQTVAAANPTVTGATASGSYPSGLGDIFVNDAVSWSANYTLTLNAHNSIYINSAITASGASGKLALEYSQGTGTGVYSVKAPVSLRAAVATASAGNFSTKLAGAATTYYTVITGLGSAGDVTSATDTNSLQGLGHSSRLSGKFVLGADIDASGTSTWNSNSGFSPIGPNGTSPFIGTFDGLGHTITGLTINRGSSTSSVGLFGVVGSAVTGGVVQNVGLVNASVIGNLSVGALVGRNRIGTISNSYFATGSVTGNGIQVGGLVGLYESGSISSSYSAGSTSGTDKAGGLVGRMAGGSILSSYATGSVSGTTNVGGLVGSIDSGTMSNSHATGIVSGTTNVGGLVGSIDGGTMSNSYATGSVNGSGDYVGGLAGYNRISFSSSYATGSVTGRTYVGGLVGRNQNGSISSSYATGNVTANGKVTVAGDDFGRTYAGGLAGRHDVGTISSSYATGNVNSTGGGSSVGGLVGFVDSGTISSSYATTGSVSGNEFVGGLAGVNLGTISSSYATRSVSGSDYVGGLVGYNGGTISSSYAAGSMSGSGSIGGLVGYNNATSNIGSSYATGNITGVYTLGGLVGQNINGLISNSYATGNVSGTLNNIGGLVGYNHTGGSISSSYATGSVSNSNPVIADRNIGGLVGESAGGTISTSYFDKGTTGQTAGLGKGTTAGITGLSTSEMQRSENFSGFNFTSTWFNYNGYTKPLLRTFLTPLSVTYTVAGSKTYDGTTACGTITCSYTTGTLTSGKNLLGTASLVLNTNNAGAVSATGTGLYSDQQGYLITASTAGAASISKAELTYTANTASFAAGSNPTGLAGALSGFVNLETQSTATTGTLAWVTPATSASGAGRYAINGSGLLADNYSFIQAASNATALTLTQAAASVVAPTQIASFVPVVKTPHCPATQFLKISEGCLAQQ